MRTESKEITSQENQVKSGGFIDPRFQSPVMAIDLTADGVKEEYQEFLKNGGTKANEQ